MSSIENVISCRISEPGRTILKTDEAMQVMIEYDQLNERFGVCSSQCVYGQHATKVSALNDYLRLTQFAIVLDFDFRDDIFTVSIAETQRAYRTFSKELCGGYDAAKSEAMRFFNSIVLKGDPVGCTIMYLDARPAPIMTSTGVIPPPPTLSTDSGPVCSVPPASVGVR